MRRAIFLALMLFISMPIVSAADINSDEDLDSTGELSGDYVVKNGTTWTVSGEYDVADDTSITIEDGATMVISGSMSAITQPQLNLNGTSSVIVPIGNLSPNGTMRIIFAEEVIFNITIEVNSVATENWTGNQFDWTGDMDVDNITVNFSHYTFQVVAISEIQLSPQGSTPETRVPSELSGDGVSVSIPDRDKAWNIDVQGTLIVTGSVFAADISCSGTCTLDGAEMTSTSPIQVTGSITVTDSTFSHILSDEDIMAWDDAALTWTNSIGTGGDTDNWVRMLTTRTIGVENGHVVFYGYDMGYDSKDTSPLRDNSTFAPESLGDNVIDIANGERERMVSWQDGDGIPHSESASGKVVLSTPWGDYEHVITDLPKVNHFDVELVLPELAFDSLVASEDENNINSRLGVMATISNSGNAAAKFIIDCVADETDANVGTTVSYTIGAQETIDIPMNWDSAIEGEITLECSIFVPYHFDGYDVAVENTATTESVSWSEEEDNSSNLFLPIVIGVLVALILYVAITRMKVNKEHMKQHLTSISDAEEDEEVGTVE